jgi:hypothetical protein
MVLLLDGASALVRSTIAVQAIKRNPQWQHLALESMKGASGTTEERATHLRLIRQCAEELALQNMHLLLTLPAESQRMQEFALFLQPDVITIHLGDDADSYEYDRTLPLATTLPDVLTVLDTYMSPEAR